jgi:hypothetical protein
MKDFEQNNTMSRGDQYMDRIYNCFLEARTDRELLSDIRAVLAEYLTKKDIYGESQDEKRN